MLQKFKNMAAKTKKKIVALATTAALTIGSAMTAMASETTELNASETMKNALEAGLKSMVSDFIGYVALVVPIGLTVFGCVWGVKKAKSFFKSVAS